MKAKLRMSAKYANGFFVCFQKCLSYWVVQYENIP